MEIKDLIENIEANNGKFEKLSKAKKRVVVAQDCLDRIKAGQFQPERNKFIDDRDLSRLVTGNDIYVNLENVVSVESCSLKDRINEIPKCTACAKGSLFLAFIGRANNFDVNDVNFRNNNATNDNFHAKLLEIFDIKQLALIEFAFEKRLYMKVDLEGNAINFTEKTVDKAVEFFKFYDGSENRMIGICENIIKNKGTFKP